MIKKTIITLEAAVTNRYTYIYMIFNSRLFDFEKIKEEILWRAETSPRSCTNKIPNTVL
jgi:hypothetical protein